MKPVMKASSIHRHFHGHKVLQGLDFHLNEGEFCAVTGKSGTGKSTLLGILGTLDMQYEGELEISGINTRETDSAGLAKLRRESLGFIFQDFHLLPNLSALDNILLPAVFSGADDTEAARTALETMKRLQLRNDSTPAKFLSRGERQRVASARALVNKPSILLADEPTASLDEESENNLFDLLDSLRREMGFAIVAVVHSTKILSRVDRVVELREGVLHEKLA
jgi:ABC-type lipoprotein export system ATPase subunit